MFIPYPSRQFSKTRKRLMERPITACCRRKFWFVAIAGFLFWSALIFLFNSNVLLVKKDVLVISSTANVDDTIHISRDGKDGVVSGVRRGRTSIDPDGITENSNPESVAAMSDGEESDEETVDAHSMSCAGRYVFVQRLPRRFNADLLRDCRSLSPWTDMCMVLSNAGLGPRIQNPGKVLSKTGWFATDQFSLEVIFHNRMKQYDCLTENSSLASAVFVPYYAGIDIARYLWFNSSTGMRDGGMRELVKWLRGRPEWKKMGGRDHFMVAGRIGWDFRRETDSDTDWGANLLLLPESRNMTILVLESTLIYEGNDYAIPYPTYFHPSSDDEVTQWQNRMRRQRRHFLFSFAGGPRPDRPNSIRGQVIDQCKFSSRRKCKLLECGLNGQRCYKPIDLMRLFQDSVFCLQPPGDSYTRRSAFDSILAGCIPVFFHKGSAYEQYKWHLPKDYGEYSVFMPDKDVRDGSVSIENVLSRIPRKKVVEMREQVIRLIPSVVYADPRSNALAVDDAFDKTVRGVLERVQVLREEIWR